LAADPGKEPSIAAALSEIQERSTLIVREEIELAKMEVTEKVTQLAKSIAVALAAGVFVAIALLFFLHGLSWLLWYVLPVGDSTFFFGFFATTLLLLIGAGVAGYLAYRWFQKTSPPVPELAIEEAKRVRDTVKNAPGPAQEPAPGQPPEAAAEAARQREATQREREKQEEEARERREEAIKAQEGLR